MWAGRSSVSTKRVILFSRSTRWRQTWSAPIDISTHHGLPRDDNGAVEGFTGAVAADGTLYVVWADGDSLVLAVSHDGGKSFEQEPPVVRQHRCTSTCKAWIARMGFPRWPSIRSGNRRDGCTSPGVTTATGDIGVYCATSDDGGTSWRSAVRVNSNPAHDGTDQFFQWLAVDPVSGAVNVDLLRPAHGSGQPEDHGVRWRARPTAADLHELRLDARSVCLDAVTNFLGDYIGLAALNEKVYGVWAEIAAPATAKADGRHRRKAAAFHRARGHGGLHHERQER